MSDKQAILPAAPLFGLQIAGKLVKIYLWATVSNTLIFGMQSDSIVLASEKGTKVSFVFTTNFRFKNNTPTHL